MKKEGKLLFSRNGQRTTQNLETWKPFVVRCPLRVVLGRIGFFQFILALSFFLPLHASEPMMKTLSAHVVKVAADGSSLDVDFRHPATEEIRLMTFHVDNQTGLSGIDKLQELRAGQVVNIDYVEGEKHRLLIRRIARVKLSGPPAGLENFRGF